MKLKPFKLEPQYRDYVWGGDRLRPGYMPTAEVWAVHENNTIANGDMAGSTLADIVTQSGVDLLGTKVTRRVGNRFPILIKLLDCNQWLSLQVHPNDVQAVELEGAGQFGKTEAWYFFDAAENAEILCGTRDGITKADIERTIKDGTILDCANRVHVRRGDYVLIPAGTIHALGPGLLVYEVQESSDITYRVFDWNRPASAGRKLHIEQSIRVIDPLLRSQIQSSTDSIETSLVTCDYFTLDKIVPSEPVSTNTAGESFHALTVIEGSTQVDGNGWSVPLEKYESLMIPACSGEYTIQKQTGCQLLRATA
ncbi:mannose-6-phosphate isomerase [Leptolinea sp. HRD-7]|nr:mannose-6-phosphate isomerase [Leptolinea sp. HRD-7]